MKVTVITPTYNRAKFLPETIKSVLKQDFADFEYLILDDGSTDDTRFVVEHFLEDSRVKYYYHDNAGEAETVNWGWSLASGEYFTQVNSDDPVYPHFLKTMVNALDQHSDAVLAYPDFDFINDRGEIISTTKGRDWNFLRNLAEFSCEAACPGSMIRRSAFCDLLKLKRRGFLHINDVEMYWNLALRGDFLHVPHVLTTWRVHDGQISSERYKCIPECEEWFVNYFSQKNIRDNVLAIKDNVRYSLCSYFVQLIEAAPLSLVEKERLAKPYKREMGQICHDFSCLHVGDNDIVGGKFNGHDLHYYLKNKNILAQHIVCSKCSSDEDTFQIFSRESDSYFRELIQSHCFLNADILHLHLMHNTPFNLAYLPFLSLLKPVVWTLHDPWVFGGHCVYPGECEKWMQYCCDCQYLQTHFALDSDTSALNFFLKKQSVQQSNIHAIVASSWMLDRVSKSPIWNGKTIHHVPFGINQERFRPSNIVDAKLKLGLDPKRPVLFARAQRNFKGVEVLRSALNYVAHFMPFELLVVGEDGLLNGLPSNVRPHEYGWISDDDKLISLYQACDIFLMPSEQEAFGMMAIEAMSCGKVVLALNVNTSSLPGVINAPDCGVAVSKEDYSGELLRLLRSPEEILSRGDQCLAFAKKEYNYETYVSRIVNVYRQVIEDFHLSEESRLVLRQLSSHVPDYLSDGSETSSFFVRHKSFGYVKRCSAYYKKYGFNSTIKKIVQKVRSKMKSELF